MSSSHGRYSDIYVDNTHKPINSNNVNDDKVSECEISSLKECFDFSKYKKITSPVTHDIENVELTKLHDNSVGKQSTNSRGLYKNYSEYQKECFWQMVIEEGSSAYKAALSNNINLRTAYTWKKNWNRKIFEEQNGIFRTPKKRGRKPLLTDEHKEFLNDLVVEDVNFTLDSLSKRLRDTFDDVNASNSTIYNFATRVCNFSFINNTNSGARGKLVEVNEKRYEWANEHKDLDFNKNCAFIDETSFNVAGDVKISLIGAICAKGCIDLKFQVTTKTEYSKNNPIGDSRSRLTASDFHCFIESVVHQITTNKEFGSIKYLVLVNAVIHKGKNTRLLLENNGLELVFLPPYSPDLNAIEEFWSECRSRIKKFVLSKNKALTSTVKESVGKIPIESYDDFCKHAGDYAQHCLDK